MRNNEKRENVTPVNETEKAYKEITDEQKIPDEQLDKVVGGYARRSSGSGEMVKCSSCGNLVWSSELIIGLCGKCFSEKVKEGLVPLI